MACPQLDSFTEEEDMTGIDPRILGQLASLAGRCKELEDRLALHVREIDDHATTMATQASKLAKLGEKVRRLFAGWRRLQDGVLFVNRKAHVLLQWALWQVQKRKDIATADHPDEQEKLDAVSGLWSPDGLPIDPDDGPDLETCTARTAQSEASLLTPSGKRPRAGAASGSKLWTPRPSEASGHSVGGGSDTD